MEEKMQDVEYVIVHAGVKGMKWGVRRAQRRANRTYKKIGDVDSQVERNKLRKKGQARDEYTDRLNSQYDQAKSEKARRRAMAIIGGALITSAIVLRKRTRGSKVVSNIVNA